MPLFYPGVIAVETSRAETAEGMLATITDGIGGFGGTITIGTTAPGSLGPRDYWINTGANPLGMYPWSSSTTSYFHDAWVTHTNTLYQNQTGATITTGSLWTTTASSWTAIANLLLLETSTLPQADSLASTGTGVNASAEDHAHPGYQANAAKHNLLGWTFPGWGATGAFLSTTPGLLYCSRVQVPVGGTAGNLYMQLTTAGGTLTANQCFAALYSASTGNKLQVTSNQATNWVGTAGTMIMPITATALTAGDYWVCWWYNGTTAPSWARGVQSQLANVGLIGSPAPNTEYGTSTGSLTTTAPPSLGALTNLAAAIWAGIGP